MTLDEFQEHFACCVNQMGKRLENNKPNKRHNRFKPSPFSIILLDEDEGVIQWTREETTFNMYHSMLCHKDLKKGKYTFIIDVDWNESAELQYDFKRVLLRVFTGCPV